MLPAGHDRSALPDATQALPDGVAGQPTRAHTDSQQLRDAYTAMVERGGEPLNPASGGAGDDGKGSNVTRGRRKRRWPWIVFPLLIILIAAAALGAIFVSQAMTVRDALQQAKDKISAVVPMVKSGDTTQLQATADDVLALTAKADEIVNGPLWGIAANVPGVGANVQAVSETTQATHILVRDAMPIALDLLSTIDVKNLKVAGGGFNLQPFRDAQPKLPAISASFAEAKQHIDKIDLNAVLPFVKENVGQVVGIVDQAAPALTLAEKYLPSLLTIMGGDGPRNYAVLFQNNAEIRATGGNPGTAAIMHIDNGAFDMREDDAVLEYAYVGYAGTGMPSIEPETKAQLFEGDTAGFVQNFTRYPDFRDTGAQISTLWRNATDSELDGVFSIDPVLLSYMLKVTGPVDMGEGEEPITAENAVKLLLSDTYERFGSDGPSADVYFAKASSAIFAKIASGDWDPLGMIDQLKRGMDEQRLYLWFPDQGLQAMSEELALGGVITSDNSLTTQTGIFLNDASYSKLGYWLSTSIGVACNAEARTMTTSLTLTNSLPDDIYSSYTLGNRNERLGFSPRTMLLDVLSMALPGGQLAASDPEFGDLESMDRDGDYNGRPAQSKFIALGQGETRTVSFTSTIPDGDTAPITVRYSPTVTQTPVTIDETCMSMFPGTTAPAAPTP